ncbi:hypothetical protein C8R43DRAFT_1107327 [Mycena crocata]|nr:hypothetical protein C8R43DRAFT_1107327 [Mycena crocata]
MMYLSVIIPKFEAKICTVFWVKGGWVAENVRREFERLNLKLADHYRKWEQSIPSREDESQEGQRRVHCPSLTDVVAAGKEARLNMATLAARMEGDADLLPASRGIRSASLTNSILVSRLHVSPSDVWLTKRMYGSTSSGSTWGLLTLNVMDKDRTISSIRLSMPFKNAMMAHLIGRWESSTDTVVAVVWDYSDAQPCGVAVKVDADIWRRTMSNAVVPSYLYKAQCATTIPRCNRKGYRGRCTKLRIKLMNDERGGPA